MRDKNISESELLDMVNSLSRLPKEDYNNFNFPLNVRSVFILPVTNNNEVNGFFFTIEPAEGYYFKSKFKETTMKYDILIQEVLNVETFQSIL